jgi:hypothetical protein
MKKWLLIILLLSLTGPTLAQSFEQSKLEVKLRMVAHELLKASGDTISLVLPVKKLDELTYRIQFESDLSIHPDTLVSIAQQIAGTFDTSGESVFEVKDCYRKETVYSFLISPGEKKDLVPCQGRILPQSCYYIEIQIAESKAAFSYLWFLLAIPVMVLGAFSYLKRTEKNSGENQGNISLDHRNQTLRLGNVKFKLTYKEYRLLELLIQQPNQIVKRDYLQKVIWEDEGVIVGRSLDMYISRLRKKLASDPSVEIENVRGEGYKFIVNS